MPEWKYFRDREGNSYFIDESGNIRIADMPVWKIRPVNANGIDYYLNLGREMIKDHRPIEGILIYKSINLLPAVNNRIIEAQKGATSELMKLQKLNGIRFKLYEEHAQMFMYQEKNRVHICNEAMRWSMKLDGSIELLRQRFRKNNDYRYYGSLIGIKLLKSSMEKESDSRTGEGYDALIAIDCEKYSAVIRSFGQAVLSWTSRSGPDAFKKKMIKQSDNEAVYAIETDYEPYLKGFEVIRINGHFTYRFRIVAPREKFDKHEIHIKSLAEGFNYSSDQ